MIVYYFEVNLITILVLFLVFHQIQKGISRFETSTIVLRWMLIATIALCVTDFLAALFRGKVFWGAHAILEIVNMLYYELILIIGVLWYLYVSIFTNYDAKLKLRKKLIICAPALIFLMILLFNPMNHFFFKIDENNLYSRRPGITLHWIVTWIYFILPTLKLLFKMKHEKNPLIKENYITLMWFVIPTAIASIIQMCFYGVTILQVGLMISLLLVYLEIQRRFILNDELTGIANKRALDENVNLLLEHNVAQELTILMMDLNHFKTINDTYGHLEGDYALKVVANTLNCIIRNSTMKLRLYRYAGDEFVILGTDCSVEEIDILKKQMREQLKTTSRKKVHEYNLEISIGSATGICASINEFQNLVHQADSFMYQDKKRLQATRK